MKNYNEPTFGQMLLIGIVGLAIICGVRLIWAKWVYGDYRCFLAECRIQVNPHQ